jgi:hypothetical protein
MRTVLDDAQKNSFGALCGGQVTVVPLTVIIFHFVERLHAARYDVTGVVLQERKVSCPAR